MLKIPFFKQDTDYQCGPAVAQMVLAFFHKRESEDALAKRMRTHSQTGTHNHALVKTMTDNGLYAYVNNESTIEELRTFVASGKPVVVNYINPTSGHGHFAVVTNCTEREMILHDPKNGKNFHLHIPDFLAKWRSGDHSARQWLMAVSDTPFPIGRQFIPTGN